MRFPLVFAVSVACAEMLVFEAIDYLTKGGFSRLGQLMSGEMTDNAFLIEAILAVTFVPIVEELFFRGFFTSSMADMGRGWTIMLPSLFFAFAHSPVKWPATFVSAVAWSIFVLETGSVAVGIACHAANNLLGTLLPLVHDALPDLTGDVAYLVFLVTGAATGLLYVREFKALWERVREYWAALRGEPGVVGGVRLLLKKWPTG